MNDFITIEHPKQMKEIAIVFKVFLLAVTVIFNKDSSNKKDFLYITEKSQIPNNEQLVNRFLLETPTTPEKAKKIIANIRKTEKKYPFLADYARKYGFPEWNFMFGSSISLTNVPSQKNIAVGTNSVHTNSTSSNKKKSYYFIPLKDSITKRVKGYIYCQQYNDSTFTYTTYDVDKILASTPQTDTAKYNKHTTLGLASYFEKQINGTEITDEFRTGFYKNVKITEVSNPNLIATNTNINSIGNQIHVVPSSGCETHHYYFIEFQGQSYMLEIKCPC